MNCPSCGAEVVGEAVFCHRCGERIDSMLPLDESREATAEEEPKRFGASISREGPNQPQGNQAELSPRGNDEQEDELELWSGGYSPKAMIPHAVGWGLASVVLIIGPLFIPWENGWKWIIALGALAIGWLVLGGMLAYRRLDVSYRLTSQRFVHKSGILRRTTDRIEVIDMDDVTYTQGIIERMLGVGTVRITSSDRTHPELLLKGIDEVRHVADKLDAARRKERVRRGLHIEAV